MHGRSRQDVAIIVLVAVVLAAVRVVGGLHRGSGKGQGQDGQFDLHVEELRESRSGSEKVQEKSKKAENKYRHKE